jgi:galactokinase
VAGGFSRLEDVSSLFAKTFDRAPSVIASAPGRVNLIGEHTDYNGGQVLPIGIAHRTWIALGTASPHHKRSKAVSASFDTAAEWDAQRAEPSGGWWDYPSGVVRAFQDLGIDVPPLDVAVVSDVPAGAGLSSSAAIEVAMGVGLSALLGEDRSLHSVALMGHKVETSFVGVASGIMDQFASALAEEGKALHLYCDTAEYEQVIMRETVLIFDTAVPRSLRSSEYNTRRAECDGALALLRRRNPELPNLASATVEEVRSAQLPAPLDRRALHVVEETRRVERVVQALRTTGTIPGEILYKSHESLRTMYECSSPELDWFVQRASTASGVHGARLTGAGWGGCAIAVGTPDALSELAHRIVDDYTSQFGFAPRTWITSASSGARVDRRAI